MSIRDKRTGRKTRNFIAIDAQFRKAERDMGNKTGKGRSRKDQKTRSMVKTDLRTGSFS